ncbi:MAG: hypothetical protein AAB917_00690 [Patescibacteria group bacterium]
MSSEKDISIEYAHIYSNSKIGDEHELSLDILSKLYRTEEEKEHTISLTVMVDDYSFPDSSFDYEQFLLWLSGKGFKPDVLVRESQLLSLADEVLWLIRDDNLRDQVSDYVRDKKYPCSLFIATWYLLRLGYISSPIFDAQFTARKLINILPLDFKPFEEKAMEIIKSTRFAQAIYQIEYKYFEGRLVV